MSFDKECEKTNTFFHKNQNREDIKSHHYIINFDPADATECGLTGEKAQALCLDFARKNFPDYQALVVTHTDGHSGSGNIHKGFISFLEYTDILSFNCSSRMTRGRTDTISSFTKTSNVLLHFLQSISESLCALFSRNFHK